MWSVVIGGTVTNQTTAAVQLIAGSLSVDYQGYPVSLTQSEIGPGATTTFAVIVGRIGTDQPPTGGLTADALWVSPAAYVYCPAPTEVGASSFEG